MEDGRKGSKEKIRRLKMDWEDLKKNEEDGIRVPKEKMRR